MITWPHWPPARGARPSRAGSLGERAPPDPPQKARPRRRGQAESRGSARAQHGQGGADGVLLALLVQPARLHLVQRPPAHLAVVLLQRRRAALGVRRGRGRGAAELRPPPLRRAHVRLQLGNARLRRALHLGPPGQSRRYDVLHLGVARGAEALRAAEGLLRRRHLCRHVGVVVARVLREELLDLVLDRLEQGGGRGPAPLDAAEEPRQALRAKPQLVEQVLADGRLLLQGLALRIRRGQARLGLAPRPGRRPRRGLGLPLEVPAPCRRLGVVARRRRGVRCGEALPQSLQARETGPRPRQLQQRPAAEAVGVLLQQQAGRAHRVSLLRRRPSCGVGRSRGRRQ
mmetsp:Transcript_42455/g.112716  ORF Transcript_42455/g.112716 Transcript_42455/m.112716 type:complete len:344 (+) Transcript_42455:111-1142(+)